MIMLQLEPVRSEDAPNGRNQTHAAVPRLLGNKIVLIPAAELNSLLLFVSVFLSSASPGFCFAEIKSPF